jgi:2-octaprenyl-6-methoxyphenol hydroxylase
MSDYDVAIVGGGMVGASLALALAQVRLKAVLIEAVAPGSQAQPSFDDRTTALGNSSRRIFNALGAWPRIQREAAAIQAIHVSDAGRFGFARLQAREQGIEAFGYVAANRVIGAALWEQLQAHAPSITLRVPAKVAAISIADDRVDLSLLNEAVASDSSALPSERITARLVVAADGAHSSVREAAGIPATVEDYEQVAVVANVATDEPHDETAYERFTPSGPLALLPLHDGSYTVVWTLTPANAERVLYLSDDAFLAELQSCFGWRAGAFVRVGRRGSYPLKLTRATQAIGKRTVLIGNAAQALHPVAGQGFNLGLRDAAMLAEVIAGAQSDPGSAETLSKFAQWRAADRRGVIGFTDGLVKLFGDARPGVGALRNLGLLLFDLMPPAKSALARVSTGFGGPSPRLARGLTLQ